MAELYGPKRRRAKRIEKTEELVRRAEGTLNAIWERWVLEGTNNPDELYRAAYEARKDFIATQDKQVYRDALRKLILAKQSDFPDLPLPGRHPFTNRLPPVKSHTWMKTGRQVRYAVSAAFQYWGGNKNYTVEEAMGWLIFSSAVWGGLNRLEALNALVFFVKGKRKIHLIDDLPVCNLEVDDDRYGNLYSADKLAYSVQFVPDVNSQLWLIHLYRRVKVLDPIRLDAEECLDLALQSAGLELSSQQLLDGASYIWEQLPGVKAPQMYSRLALGHQRSCSLSAPEMAMTLQEEFEPSGSVRLSAWLLAESGKYEDSKSKERPDTEKVEDRFISIRLRRMIQSKAAARRKPGPELDSQKDSILSEYDKDHLSRLTCWVYNLITEHPSLGISSVLRYLSAIVHVWLREAQDLYLDELDADEWTELYSAILLDAKNSTGPTLTALNNFHDFQIKAFDAPPIELTGTRSVEHVRARYVSADLIKKCLSSLRESRAFNESESLMLQCMIILAWRTAIRVGELTALAIRDLSIGGGPEVLQMSIDELLVRSNSLGTIKTENANRRIPVHALLTTEEHSMLDAVLHYRMSMGAKPNDPLFSPTTRDGPFNKNLVATIFRRLTVYHMDGSEYPFHSLRHTALTSLSLILTNSSLARFFVDRSVEDQHEIRAAMLGKHPGSDRPDSQDQFVAVAQLAGHGLPDQTFRAYYHFAHIDLGQRLINAELDIPSEIPGNVASISRRRISTAVRSHTRRSTSVNSQELRPLLLKDLDQWIRPWSMHLRQDTQTSKDSLPRGSQDDDFNYYADDSVLRKTQLEVFPEQRGTHITMELMHTALGYADQGENAAEIAARFSVSSQLIQRWLDRARFFSVLPSGRGSPRLIDPARLGPDGEAPLQPFKRFSEEEYVIIEKFFRWAPKAYYNNPEELLKFMNIYLKQATGRRAMVRFRMSERDILREFLGTGIKVLSASHWRLLGPSKKMCLEMKSKSKRWKNLTIGEPLTDYNGFAVALRRPNEDEILESSTIKRRAYSSAALRYIVHMLLIAWPGSDIGRKRLLKDPFQNHS